MADSGNKWSGPKIGVLWEQFNRLSAYALVENPTQADALVGILAASPLVRRVTTYSYEEGALNNTGERLAHYPYTLLKQLREDPESFKRRGLSISNAPLPAFEDTMIDVDYWPLTELGMIRKASLARVLPGAPHTGVDVTDGRTVEVYWWAIRNAWFEKEMGSPLPFCACVPCAAERKKEK